MNQFIYLNHAFRYLALKFGISFLAGIMAASFLFLVVSNKGKRKIIRSGKKLLRFTPTDVTSKVG